MKTEKQIRQKLKAIEQDIPKFFNDEYILTRLIAKKELIKWILGEDNGQTLEQ